jgi:hypothetical protein
MLIFTTKTPLIVSPFDTNQMFGQTMQGMTEHTGTGTTAAQVLNQMSDDRRPFLLLGIPGKSYIVANLVLTMDYKVKDIIQIATRG